MRIDENKVFNALLEYFPHEPNADQKGVFRQMVSFLINSNGRPAMILNGYAGTGKTTSITTLIKVLPKLRMKFVLLAPTGRAAKVITTYTGQKAHTIHKKIYKQENSPEDGALSFVRQQNYHKNTVFIVDEASMIPNSDNYGQRSLLKELIDYVFEKEGNRLLLIGDEAQLPPVNESSSPALEPEIINLATGSDVTYSGLKDVVRQQQGSGILANATMLRNGLYVENYQPKFKTKSFGDIYRMTGDRFEEGLRYAYDKYGEEEAIVICRSNKNANMYNQFIRRTMLFREEEIDVGDTVMIVKNNYFWVTPESEMGFVANGDFAEIRRAGGIEEMHGMRFCDMELKFLDYPDQPAVQVKVLVDTLYVDGPSITNEQYKELYHKVSEDYADIPKKRDRLKAIREDKYLNALQIKFAYAITCHKSQGGQWSAVFLDHGYKNPEISDEDHLRWLYTACTRAKEELFLVNFDKEYF